MDMKNKRHVCKFTCNKSLNKTMMASKCEAKRFELRLILKQSRKTMGGEGGQ